MELVVIDDLILDVSHFMMNHPGGKFLIQFNIGRDISKFFYGGYVLEATSSMRPHTHSNVARSIVNTLVIARLEDKAKTFSVKISESSPITDNVTTFVLKVQGPDPNFRHPASNDIQSIG
jgi:cytochrome b involved in lipid metabolism